MKFIIVLLLSLAAFPVISFSQSNTCISIPPIDDGKLWNPGTFTMPSIGRLGSGNILSLSTSMFGDGDVISTYDTVMLFKGIDTTQHVHNFVRPLSPFTLSFSCAVNHGPTGCPSEWLYTEEICTICLRNFTIKESRKFKLKDDKFQEAKTRLNNLLKK